MNLIVLMVKCSKYDEVCQKNTDVKMILFMSWFVL